MNEPIKFLKNLLNINDTIVVATSGGPDSMCLLHLINLLKDEYNLNIICAHVNHGLRKESDNEKKFVENFCVINNLKFEYTKLNNYKNNKFSESEGRSKRYAFFNDIVKKYDAKYLMTAHHGDDLIETVLMRIVRGSNLKGYVGIPKITRGFDYTLVRPLLFVTKDDIMNYLKVNNISYVIDKSNEDIKYTRNRYRSKIIPKLKEEDENVHLKFLKYSEELEETNDYINNFINNKKKKIIKNNVVDLDLLNKENPFIIKRLISSLIEDIQVDNILNISDKQLDSILTLIKNGKNKEINLSDNFIARVSYNKFIIEQNNIMNDYEYILDDKLTINNFIFESIDKIDGNSNYIIRLNSKEVKLPLKIRNRKNGDIIKVKNLNGTKKIKDVFIDSKVDLKKRNNYPLLVDSGNNILLVPGIKKSIFAKDIHEKYDIIIRCEEK